MHRPADLRDYTHLSQIKKQLLAVSAEGLARARGGRWLLLARHVGDGTRRHVLLAARQQSLSV